MVKKRNRTAKNKSSEACKNNRPKPDATELLSKVDELVESLNYQLSLQCVTMGNVYAELRNIDSAKQHYMSAVNLQPKKQDYVTYLYLGQLSEGWEAVEYFNEAIAIMKKSRSAAKCVGEDGGVTNRDMSNVYCSLAEVYMTDCCMEEGAQRECEKACQQALIVDGENPEAYLAMCNLLLTKHDIEGAKKISVKVYELWESLTGMNDGYDISELMPYEARLTLIKILIEVDLCASALKISVQLLEENEEDTRIWYYIGLLKSLVNEVSGQRRYLDTALYLYEKHQHDDIDMLEHIHELLNICDAKEKNNPGVV